MKTEINFAGIKMKNPVTVASGCFGYGRSHHDFINLNKLGAIITKGTSMKPKLGNKPHRICETTSGMMNCIGLENPGLDYFVENDLPFLKQFDTPIIVNCFGGTEGTIEAYVQICEALNNLPIDGVEINLSCPNVKAGCLAFGTTYEGVKEITSACRKVLTSKPLIVKLTPNVTDITLPAKGAEEAGADAISLINTLTAMKIDIETRRPVLSINTGGLSGPAIKPVAVRMVYQAAHSVKIPVMGLGGIMTGEDVIEFMMAGATCVSVGSANLIDPTASIKIIDGMEKFMKSHNIDDINSVINSVQMN